MSRKKANVQLTTELIYKKNKKKSKICSILAPITWYLFLALTIIFLCFTVRNSIGNVTEILNLLDKNKYNGQEIEANYKSLVDKWGEWEILGNGSNGLSIKYIDIGHALFSGLMITFSTLTVCSFLIAFIFGKIVFPMLSKHFKESNDEMVDMATLKSASQIDEMSKKSKKEWF